MRLLLFNLFIMLASTAFAAPRIAVHGHRGAAAVRPENTIPSFEEAARAGADYVELDVYASKDNHLIVAHDPTITSRLCVGPANGRPIRSLTLKEIREYDCGSVTRPSSPRYVALPGTRIPTLNDVFALAEKYPRIRFNIEIKSSDKWTDYTPAPKEFCDLVVSAIRQHKLQDRVLVQSFDFRIVKAMKVAGPEIELATLYGSRELSLVDVARETGVKMVNPESRLVTAGSVKAAHEAGIRMMVWTVDTPQEWDRLIGLGVDGIITNDPEALVAHLTAKGLR